MKQISLFISTGPKCNPANLINRIHVRETLLLLTRWKLCCKSPQYTTALMQALRCRARRTKLAHRAYKQDQKKRNHFHSTRILVKWSSGCYCENEERHRRLLVGMTVWPENGWLWAHTQNRWAAWQAAMHRPAWHVKSQKGIQQRQRQDHALAWKGGGGRAGGRNIQFHTLPREVTLLKCKCYVRNCQDTWNIYSDFGSEKHAEHKLQFSIGGNANNGS